LLLLSFAIAFAFFYEGRTYPPFHDLLVSFGYVGTFFAEIFYSYGFTAAPATAIFLVLAREQDLIFAGLIGGLGALLSDIVIFLFIRRTFIEEIQRMSNRKFFKGVQKNTPKILREYLTMIFAGFIIASPLPTEIGVTLMAASRDISTKKFTLLAYLLHTTGISAILLAGAIT